MNIVKIYGGIGNQMFQYAFGKVLQQHGKDVAYDVSWHKDNTDVKYPRPFRLDKFQVEMNIHPFISKNPTIIEKRVGYNLTLFNMNDDYNFEGYWQWYNYYEKIISILQKELQLKSECYTDEFLKLADEIMDCNSISIHVRRGDYQLHRKGAFRDLSAKYYFSAISELGIPNGRYYIFSDDIPWCKETFKQVYFTKPITFVDLEDYLCFELMKFCKHNIVTNSTFSWWAAVLNENAKKKVICPLTFMGTSPEDSAEHRWPKEWIKIEDYAVYNV